MKRTLPLLVLMAGPALAVDIDKMIDYPGANSRYGTASRNEWVEGQATPPAFPKDSDLVEFHVSAGATNRFMVDASTLSVGEDGVVRYVLVVKTPGGATNVTYEGIHCKTGEYKLFASGRSDGTWANSRTSAWRPIENKPVNRHHAVLNRELFCPVFIPIANPDEGREALRLGKHPRAL